MMQPPNRLPILALQLITLAIAPLAFAYPATSAIQAAPAAAPSTVPSSTNPSPEPSLKQPADYLVDFSARAWYVAPAGRINFPGAGSLGTPLSFFSADEPTIRPAIDLKLASGDWLLFASGANVSTDRTSVAPGAATVGGLNIGLGNTVRASVDYTTAMLAGGYKVLDHNFEPSGASAFRGYVLVGARLNDLDLKVERPGVGIERSASTAYEALGGFLGELTFAERFSLNVQTTFGGLKDSESFDLGVALRYRPIDWLTLDIGYRLIINPQRNDLPAGRFKFDGSYAGLLFGASVRF